MIDFPYIRDICHKTPTKIVLLVIDGLGGIPHSKTGKSELESAYLPNLDDLATRSATGMTIPVAPGITPGSGPGHTALFGYDPVKYLVGRGVLEALGLNVNLEDGEVAVRGNFCTVDKTSNALLDRRAGRISSIESTPLAAMLNEIKVPGIQIAVHPGKDYRFVLTMRGDNLGASVSDTDPIPPEKLPSSAMGLTGDSRATAIAANEFISKARQKLSGQERANMVLLRGFSKIPSWPQMDEVYSLNPAAIAAYPMYRGLAGLLGMKILDTGSTFDEQLVTLENSFKDHDFFFLHYKAADAAGEDGNFEDKIKTLEDLDKKIPQLMDLDIDTLVVAGDHSTPAILASHSWHAVPLLINASHTEGEGVEAFNEKACATGSIGQIPASNVMTLALANAGKLVRFGP